MTRIGMGHCALPPIALGLGRSASGGTPFAAPPEDWRMPATVALSSGDATALNAAQATAASKTRPSITVAASGTNTITYSFAASSAPLILSWTGQQNSGSITINGGAFTPVFPSGSSVEGSGSGRRQFALVAPGATSVALQITSGASAQTIFPVLHQLPASGTWDAHVAFGASREDQGMGSSAMEAAIIAAFPARDPIVFNYAKSSASVSDLATLAPALATAYGDVACYASLGSIIGNDISASRPYDSGEKAALDASIATLVAALSGFVLGFGNTSYRAYTGGTPVTPAAQTSGSLPYNDNVIHPAILLHAPDCHDASLSRSRIDEYALTLFQRAALSDEVHGSPTQYSLIRAFWADQWYRFVYTGSWGTGYTEQRVAAVEATPTLTLYDEAGYVVAALVASAGKTVLLARLAAIYPAVLLDVADGLIDAAETLATQSAVDDAQAALDAAEMAGANPATVAAYQARIDAIDVVTIIQTVRIGHGSATAVTGWNRTDATAIGVAITNLLNTAGASTGWGLEIINAATSNSTNTALTSLVPDVPDAILLKCTTDTGTTFEFKLTGLDNAKVYDLRLMPCRTTGSSRPQQYRVNGVNRSPIIEAQNNASEVLSLSGIAPISGEITIRVVAQSGGFMYHTVTEAAERVA